MKEYLYLCYLLKHNVNTTMKDFEELLECRASMATVNKIVSMVSGDGEAIGRLCMIAAGGLEHKSGHAAWALTHLSKEDKTLYITPYRDLLTDNIVNGQATMRPGLLLNILIDIYDDDNPRTDLLDFCLEGLADRKYKDGCRSLMIKLAARMCRPWPELKAELHGRLELLPPELPPSIASAKRNAMKCKELKKQ